MTHPNELKPCPFCGGQPIVRVGSDFTKPNCSVRCCKCFASTAVCGTDAEAREVWNRRPAPAVPDGLLNLLTDLSQLVSTIKIEWELQSAWSTWDQSVQDDLLAMMCHLSRPLPQREGRMTVAVAPSPSEKSP